MKTLRLWQSSPATAALIAASVVAACTASVGSGTGTSSNSGGNGSTLGGGGGAGNNGGGGGNGGGGNGGAGNGGGNTGAGMSGGTMTPATTGTGAPGQPPLMMTPESAGLLVMRRLTYREYDHMLADLFGDTTAPAETQNWSPDVTGALGFILPTGVASLQVTYYNQTADAVVQAALANVAAGKPAGKFAIPCTTPANMAAETACATQFVTAFGLEAFRRPVAAAEQTDLLALFTAVRGYGLSFTDSIGAVAKSMIQSPNFLYHWEIGPTKPVVDAATGLAPLTQWQIASRLAMALWETMPDDNLLTAAQGGMLSTPAQVAAQVTRMMQDPKAAQSLFAFHSQLLLQEGIRITDITQITKDPALTLYTPAAAAGLQTEFTSYVTSVYSGDGTLGTLLAPAAPYAYVNHDLAAIYGVTGPAANGGFMKVMLNPAQRAGILTQTAFLAANASPSTDNPVFRGLNIWTKLLCGTYMPPPPVVPTAVFKPGTTTRQTFESHAACAAACHGVFDPPGFAFENYDAIGAYRTT